MGEHDFTPGRWVLTAGFGGRFDATIYEIVKATDKIVKVKAANARYTRSKRKDEVLAAFATKEEAETLASAIAGIRGELNRRVKAANDAAEQSLARLLGQTCGQ